MSLMRRVCLVLGAILVLGVAASGSRASSQAPETPVFRTDVNLIAVDVMVVGSDGRPVMGLEPESFDVRIDGRRRRVAAAEFVQYDYDTSVGRRSEGAANIAGTNSLPVSGAPARSFVLAVDTFSFFAGEMVYVQRSARAFIDRLDPSDLVGVVTLPRGSILSPTTDRVAVRKAIDALVGLRSLMTPAFNLSAAEVVDISAEDDQMNSLPRPTTPGRGAATPSIDNTGDVLRQVQLRECRGGADAVCMAGILAEAETMNRLYEEQAEQSVAGLQRLVQLLAEYPTRRTVVLVSGGMPVSDRQGTWYSDGGSIRRFGRAVAQANATVFALHVDRVASDIGPAAESRAPRRDLARERELNERLLDEIAVTSGGALLNAPTGSPSVVFDRLLVEVGSVYLLGVAPDSLDLDGRPHELSVRVNVRGAEVRSRKFVVLRPPTVKTN